VENDSFDANEHVCTEDVGTEDVNDSVGNEDAVNEDVGNESAPREDVGKELADLWMLKRSFKSED